MSTEPRPIIQVRRASADDRPALARMLELYQYELSDIWDQDLDAEGEYGYELDAFFSEKPSHSVFIAGADGRHAGFALVDDRVKIAPAGHWMAQFFVMKKYRHSGIGALLARQAFAELPGYWEVGEMTANGPAQAFWRRVIAEQTGGNYTERILAEGWWQGVVQCFTIKAR